MIKHFTRNTTGRDLVVGDIHGHFTKLQRALDAVGFDPAADRLFSVGDLVDRGPESNLVIEWLAKPWFFPVIGNHEDMAIRWGLPGCRMDRELYARNGGAWNIGNTAPERLTISDALSALPLAIEVETAEGLVGIIHAEPTEDWDELRAILQDASIPRSQLNALRQCVLWDRSRVEEGYKSGIKGLRAAAVGHTPVKRPGWLGDVLYVDTGAWASDEKQFALINLATLAPVAPHLVTE